jgi:hypothetical protein
MVDLADEGAGGDLLEVEIPVRFEARELEDTSNRPTWAVYDLGMGRWVRAHPGQALDDPAWEEPPWVAAEAAAEVYAGQLQADYEAGSL